MATSTLKQETSERIKLKKKLSKAQMQLAIIKKKQCDAKALTIVEQLIEPNIEVQWLLSNLRYINKCHMEDVIEERAVIKLCGYVLCVNVLTVVINQQYHISTRRNKVYDVTRRKNFCSSRCYGACNYLLEQMLTSPLWLRDKEAISDFKVLPIKYEPQRSIPGDEIHLVDTNMVLNPNSKDHPIELNETYNNSKDNNKCPTDNTDINIKVAEISNNSETLDLGEDQFLENSVENSEHTKDEILISKDITSTVEQCSTDNTNRIEIQDEKELNNDIISLSENKNQNKNNEQKKLLETEIACNAVIVKEDSEVNNGKDVQKIEKNESKKYKQKYCVKEKQRHKFYNLAMNIECNIKEWITKDTISLLSGEEEIKNKLLENITQHDRYLHLCKKLNKFQLTDEKDDADLTKNSLKPMPHLSVLQEEGKKMELKVKAFFKGDMVIQTPEKVTENTQQNDDFAPVLPLTDSHDPRALRRRIFLDKLNRILPDLVRALASTTWPQYTCSNNQNALIKALVNTFSLSATNIIFKTAEWTLVGLIIIKMLSMIDPQLKNLLLTRQASMYISMILMSYKLDSNYLDRLVMELINDTKAVHTNNTTHF
ncbi:PREDICTED: putative RNA polymerase II subunit B1 CTD phosphatase RPAP2 [Dufourea novaeangliae]|uniref:RNA polymerase II subunit B1 CTD phosphatase RPAP2 homolog n=1 Tax=Dufourea novaeangliae TaxID=178035 RepID=A0A154P923_DUFNO|nr:PREDICTED: putative RNA polymerase II subunit B1 CTD phosphatase RPAP2 [Dufourea novaeangliae]KZC08436.1 Putative RNA polymerase II subunit B1 CTD phosphatase RPAP2 [Dufourea novaeangliae]